MDPIFVGAVGIMLVAAVAATWLVANTISMALLFFEISTAFGIIGPVVYIALWVIFPIFMLLLHLAVTLAIAVFGKKAERALGARS